MLKIQLQFASTMLKSMLIVLGMLAGFAGTSTAADQTLETVLTNRYRGQILALRHSFQASSQDYDSQGNPMTNGSEGSWTVYGRIDVRKVAIAPDRLQLEGEQVVFEGKGNTLKPVRKHEPVKINIRLNQALASEDEAVAILGRMFALTPDDVVSSAPSLWQPYLAKQLNVSGRQDYAVRTGSTDKPPEPEKMVLITEGATPEKVFRLGKEIVAPKPLFTPEPSYSAIAKKQRTQGRVTLDCLIDSKGNIRRITVVHPMGLGLDEAAAEAVRTWRFSPATMDGRPVAVAFFIEIDFHLY